MDAEHERCAAALETLRQDLKPASLAAVLKEVETHFAHEEELLDRYVYKQPGGGGFSADAGARKKVGRWALLRTEERQRSWLVV